MPRCTVTRVRRVPVGFCASADLQGFKHLNQSQLLGDFLWAPDALDAQQWLIYFISRPLIGSLEPVPIVPAALPDPSRPPLPPRPDPSSSAQTPQKKDVKSFSELLNSFPMIARQMQPGLERVFREFADVVEKAPSRPPSAPASESDGHTLVGSVGSGQSMASEDGRLTNGHAKSPATATSQSGDDQETLMRGALETAVTAAIDLFQLVDKQQLSLLGATTDLTGPASGAAH